MKAVRSTEKIMSFEYLKASKRLDKSRDAKSGKRIISIRSITPETILNQKDGRKHQCSFSYVPKTKTPSVQPKVKLGSTYKYFRGGKYSKSSDRTKTNKSIPTVSCGDITKQQSQTCFVKTKFSSRNSKNNTNSDTLCSIRSNRSKKGSNVNSITSDRDRNYYEKWKQLRCENKKLVKLLEDNNETIATKVKQFKLETEVLTNLLLELLPIVKNQLKLEDYQSRDFKQIGDSNGIKTKQNLLSKIKSIKLTKGFSTASSEDDLKLKVRLENANKTIKELRINERNLLNRISNFELSEASLRQTVKNHEQKIAILQSENKAFLQKLLDVKHPSKQQKEFNEDPICSIAKCKEWENLLECKELTPEIGQSSPDVEYESLLSTDENFLGTLESKEFKFFHPTRTERSVPKICNKSAIGPKNLEMRQCNKSIYLADMKNQTMRSRMHY